MSEALPISIEDLENRRFAFYPAIVNVEHNEWLLERASWSEVLVKNVKSGESVWIPRQYIGEVSSVDEPLPIVGLRRELELKAGAVWPRERRVLAMPKFGAARPSAHEEGVEAPPAVHRGFGASPGTETRISRLIGGALLLGIALLVLVVAIVQRPVAYKSIEQLALELNANDDYNSIVRKLGVPSEDRWQSNVEGQIQFRALRFKSQPYTLILMGLDRDSARYIGALDKNWKPVHVVRLPGGGDTSAILQRVPKF